MPPRNLVLIDSRLPDISGITNSLTGSTDFLIYNYYTNTLTTLYTDISNLATLHSATYINIALAQDTLYERSLTIVNLSDTEALIADTSPYNTFSGLKTFLTNLRTNLGTTSFNFLACNIYAITNIPAILSALSSEISITLRASNDITGSTALNIGNYIMESDSTNITNTFFTSSINNYTHPFIMDWFNNNQYDASKNIVATNFAFATKDISGRVWAWGDINNGGAGTNSTTAATPVNLSGIVITDIYSTIAAFAAKDSSGNIWVWGNQTYGGSPTPGTAVKLDISNAVITTIVGNSLAFSALDTSGKVWNWTYTTNVTTSSNNTNGMAGETILSLYSCSRGFAALSSTGKVWTWGDIDGSSGVSDVTTAYIPTNLPSTIIKVYGAFYAFAALTSSNTLWSWGNTSYGGLGGATGTAGQLSNPLLTVKEIYASGFSFTAITTSNEITTVSTWGDGFQGGALTAANFPVTLPLTKVATVASTIGAFASLDTSGRIVSWGDFASGSGTGTSFRAIIPYNLSGGIKEVYGYGSTFAALDLSNYVHSWGDSTLGGTNGLSPIDISRTSIDSVYSNTKSFAVIDTSGRVWAWGSLTAGGVGSTTTRAATPTNLPTGIISIYATMYAYAAIDSSGHIWTWGDTAYGGTGTDAKTAAIPTNMADVIIPIPPAPEPPVPPTPPTPQTIMDILNSLAQKNRPASEEDNRIVGRILSGEQNFTSYSDYKYRMIAANIGASCNC